VFIVPLSTFTTDYVLIKANNRQEPMEAPQNLRRRKRFTTDETLPGQRASSLIPNESQCDEFKAAMQRRRL
jgi:hypothetical protein